MERPIIQDLMDLGATFKEPFTFGPSRSKVSGRMWDGNAILALNGVDYRFELWHHGADEETEASLFPQLRLKGIKINGQYYDINWYVLLAVDCIWLHEEGWFRDTELRENPLVQRRGNPNFVRPQYTTKESQTLRTLGFRQLAVFEMTL